MTGDGQFNRKTTVAHFMPWSGVGGVEIATLRMADLMSQSFRNIAFCLHDALELRESFENLGIETITYVPPEPSLRHANKYFKDSLFVARQIRQTGADIVHFSDEKAAYHNSLAAFLARTRIVCHIRTSHSHLSLRQRLCLSPVHSFIFVSKDARKSLQAFLPDKKTRVIYDAIEIPTADMTESNAQIRRDLGIPVGAPIVGMVARVAPVKDYFTLALAAADVLDRYPDTRFIVVGDNSLVALNRSHYIEVAQKLGDLGISNRFIFTGHRTDVARLISAMDISVLCSHREGFGLCILESMAMGKPVVATDVGGIPEIVRPGVTGYLHQHQNSEELAKAINSFIGDPEMARQFGNAGRDHVRQHYSRQKFVEEISKAYSDVMQR